MVKHGVSKGLRRERQQTATRICASDRTDRRFVHFLLLFVLRAMLHAIELKLRELERLFEGCIVPESAGKSQSILSSRVAYLCAW